MKIKKIFISGGWGYRNLGDDSLLKVTIEIVNRYFFESTKTIATYDINTTKEVIDDTNILLTKSVDRLLFGRYFTYKWFAHGQSYLINYLNKIKNKVSEYFVKIVSKTHLLLIIFAEPFYLFLLKKTYINKRMKGTDLFLMSGGGYFNSWETSLIARYVEIKAAKLVGAKIILLAQTIGPFLTRSHKKIAIKCLKDCDNITVRDYKSYIELKEMGIKVEDKIIPDLALYKTYQIKKKKIITIVPFYKRIKDYGHQIVEVLKEVQEATGYSLRITVSQHWKGIVENALLLQHFFKTAQCHVEFVYPLNVNELQTLLGESEIVISQNLHGLILAYRANSKIISLNNQRKFQTFMEIINRCPFVVPIESFNKNKFKSAIYSCLKENINCHEKDHNLNFSLEIENDLNKIFQKLEN